jgi:hypothetical protein
MVGGSSFDTAVSYDVDSLINESGNNELDIAVTNIGVNGADATTNPAGVMYKLVIEGEVTSDADCATPYVPPRDDEDELSCEITVNDNSIQEGGDVTLTWSSIGAAFANLDGDSVAANDSLVVEDVDEDTTFTLTVYDEQENSAECSVSVDTRSGGGGGGGGGGNRAGDRDGRVLGDSDSIEPEPLVLGEQVSAVPAGAPDAGAGGTSSRSLEFFQVAPVALVGRTRKHG